VVLVVNFDDEEEKQTNLEQASEAAKAAVNKAAMESIKAIQERNRRQDPWEEEGFWVWWGRTSPPNRKEKEAILHLPAPPAKKGGSKKGRKRKNKKISDLRQWIIG
jgi:hypothetical protein